MYTSYVKYFNSIWLFDNLIFCEPSLKAVHFAIEENKTRLYIKSETEGHSHIKRLVYSYRCPNEENMKNTLFYHFDIVWVTFVRISS